MYCKKCGGKIESYASHCPFCGEAVEQNSVEATYTSSSIENGSTKSVGAWILAYIITLIPVVGLVMLFVWAFSDKTKNDRTFKNWAKAQLVIMLISIVLSMIMLISMLPVMFELMEELSKLPIE